MVQLKLATTASAGLRPLGAPGQRSFELIVPTVQRALGERHAQLFAEPIAAPLGDATDWYATVPGSPQRLVDLEPAEQREARETLGGLVGDVFALADRLATSPDAESQRLAQALRNALEVPDETAIFVVGGQPVLTNWAHRQDVKEAPRGVLSAMIPMRPRPAPEPVPVAAPAAAAATTTAVAMARSPLDWLWWVTVGVTGAVLAAIVWLLVAPCGLAGPAWLNACPRPAQAMAVDPALEARRGQLEAEIAALERQALLAERNCARQETAQAAPPPPAPAPEPAPEPEPTPEPEPEPDEIDRRREAAGGERGELTITLVWNSRSDLDLHVTCPNGETLYFRNPNACGSGVHDVDANASDRTQTPVENVRFGAGAPHGTYTIRVNFYDAPSRYGSSHDFTVRVEAGERTETFQGTVTNARRDWRTTFDYRG